MSVTVMSLITIMAGTTVLGSDTLVIVLLTHPPLEGFIKHGLDVHGTVCVWLG